MSSGKKAGFSPTLPWPSGPATEGFDRWQSTQARTVISTRSGEDDAQNRASAAPDIGRAVDDRTSELIVSCDPAPALLQQFEHAHPVFIAVHDVGTTSSRGLIAAVAEARGLEIKRLVIRRQGFGTTLAALEFIEFPGPNGARLRVYCTAAEADAYSREGLARVLLSFSRLGVLMVGNLTGKALTEALRPLRDDIVAGPWPNRDLMLVADAYYLAEGLAHDHHPELAWDRDRQAETFAALRAAQADGVQLVFSHDVEQWESLPAVLH